MMFILSLFCKKVSEFVYYIAALKYVLVKTLAATCFCQNGGKTKGGMEKEEGN